MPESRIARTRTQDLQPLGTAGQLAAHSWGVLSALLRQELSPAHAALLAEPVADTGQGETDWYSDLPGEAVPLASLAPEARAAVRARLETLVADIAALGQRLLAGHTDGERFSGEMLLLCIQVPDQGRVMAIGSQPILVGWGHARAGVAPEPAVVTGRRAPAMGSMVILPPPRGPAPRGRNLALLLTGVFGGTLTAAVLGALLWFDPFGWSVVSVAQCTVPPDQPALAAVLQDAVTREGALQLELARLGTDAGQRRLRCTPVSAPAPPSRHPLSADTQRAERQGARSGKLQIILAWDDRNDLDLHVLCPGGGAIDFAHSLSCGGNLDVDANGDVNNLTDAAVENAFFSAPRAGRYGIVVDPYEMRVRANTPFRVTIRQESLPDREVTGIAVNGRRNQVVAEVDVAAP